MSSHTSCTQIHIRRLPDDPITITIRAREEFNKSISAFEAAKKYGLSGLQELAKIKMSRWGEYMEIIEATQAIGEDLFTRLQDHDLVWLQDLILQKVEAASNKDDAIFSTTNFFNDTGSLTLAKLLAQRVAKSYHERILELRTAIYLLDKKPFVSIHGAGEELTDVVPSAPSERPMTEAPPPAPAFESTVHDWGFETTKKKGKEKALHQDNSLPPMPSVTTEPAAEPEPEPAVNGSVLNLATEARPTSNGDDCSLNFQHIFKGDGWKSCTPCGFYMRRFAISSIQQNSQT